MSSDTGVSLSAEPDKPASTSADPTMTADSATATRPASEDEQSATLPEPLHQRLVSAEDDAAPAAIPVPSERASAPISAAPLPTANAASSSAPQLQPPPPPPSIHKRKRRGAAKGILKPAPPPTKAFSFRRDILQQLNTRLAQQGVNVQVPVPQGSLAGTAQGTAQAASSLLGGFMKRVSGFAAGGGGVNTDEAQGKTSPLVSPNRSGDRRSDLMPVPPRSASMASVSSENSNIVDNGSASSSSVVITSNNNLPQPSASVRPLRKVRFIVSDMTVTYPISGAITPGEEDATRRRVEQEQRARLKARKEKRWTVLELEQLYRECCRTREEHPLKRMRGVFQEARHQSPQALKTIDLSFIPLDRQAIEPVADLLSIDFSLQKLVLENCGLTDEGLKSILHALLVSGTLPNLSLASNKRIRYHGWRYVGIFMRRAKALKYLDLSENNINRASLEHIAGALTRAISPEWKASASDPATELDDEDGPLTTKAKLLEEDANGGVGALTSLRLENCGLKTASLEMLAQAVRFSALCHLSLRRNRINQTGAVALAAMLKDYPDNMGSTADMVTPAIAGGADSMRGAVRGSMDDARGRNTSANHATVRSGSPGLPQIPYIVSSPGGGVTRRTLPASALAELQEATSEPLVRSNGQGSSGISGNPSERAIGSLDDAEQLQAQRAAREQSESDEVAAAIYQALRAKRILSTMPRVGSLLTLDLKSNDIRGGIVYLSQALKKNRTLKVLNLSDNGIEMMGLVAVADALKYNSTLETLDMSHNPCSGPGLEGITTLRNAFTLNSNLKRLFLSDTELSSEGAIALAEFLPEARSLIHLDLTENLQIDIAGVMALAVSVKMNKSLRCLDLNIPPNAPDFARLSQDILASCIRNTELAQRRAQQKGVKAPIAAPIYKSTLARAAKEKEESERLQAANQQLEQIAAAGGKSTASSAPNASQNDADGRGAARITDAAQECVNVLRELLEREREHEKARSRERETIRRADGTIAGRTMSEFARDLLLQSQQLRGKLVDALGVMHEGKTLERALQVNDELDSITAQLNEFFAGGRAETTEERVSGEVRQDAADTAGGVTAGNLLEVPRNLDEDGLSSPNFSIGSDDDDDDDAGAPARSTAASSIVNDASLLLASSSEAALAGLGIGEVVTATREIPSEGDATEQIDPETALANNRAKGQLSEEGEIFRRAKSLSIGEDEREEDEDDDVGEHATLSGSEASVGERGTGAPLPSDSTHSASKNDLNSVIIGSDDTTSDDRTEVSGEELRKELLGTHVPRRGSASSTTSTAGAAAASLVGGLVRPNESSVIPVSQSLPEEQAA